MAVTANHSLAVMPWVSNGGEADNGRAWENGLNVYD